MKKIVKFINKYKLIFIIVAVVIAVIAVMILNEDYRKEHYTETWVVCEFKPVYTNYKETVKFRYVGNTMYGYYRNEVFTEAEGNTDENKTLDAMYTYFNDTQTKLTNNDNFSYIVTKTDTEVDVDTYINVSIYKSDFDEYVTDLYVDSDMTASEIKSTLEGTNYTCELSQK